MPCRVRSSSASGKAGMIHVGIGKASLSEGDLKENFTALRQDRHHGGRRRLTP